MISVIVPVYNAEPYLDQCLQSILHQTYADLEIIVIDDCSTDQSLNLCRAYAKKDKRVKVLANELNQGQVLSYTRGIQQATGDYIIFVDSDDWIELDMIEKLYQALRAHQSDIAVCGCWQTYPERKFKEPEDIDEIGLTCFSRDEVLEAAYAIHVPTNTIDHILKLYRCNKLFKKKLLLNNLMYTQAKIRVFEDNNLVIPCLLDADRIVYVNQPLYYYRRSHASTMSLFNEEVLQSGEKFLQNQEYIFKKKGVSHDMRSDVYVVCAYMINSILKLSDSLSQKRRYLQTVTQWIRTYDVKPEDVRNYGASKKFSYVFSLVAHQRYAWVLIMAAFYHLLKK